VPEGGAPPDATELRRRFDTAGGFTVGLEEEAMLLDPQTLDLAPVADDLLAQLARDRRFKRELPAAQLETATTPAATVPEAIAQLAIARRDLAAAARGLALVAVAAVHPFAPARGRLNRGPPYDPTRTRFGPLAERQLVAALQVHVAVGGAERTLAVMGALRCFLPELTALAANGPFHHGEDTGLATIRPLVSQLLPRQGIPPRIESWEAFVRELSWGRASGALPQPGSWWWELRPHLVHGTIEVRVPDAQTSLGDAAAVASFVQALVATLAEQYDRGDPLPHAPTWRIEENRWCALQHGLDGTMADLTTGERIATRERLEQLLEELAPAAERLRAGPFLPLVRALIRRNGAMAQRDAHESEGIRNLPRWLVERYLEPL
jgi:carboxylate-amine ligase